MSATCENESPRCTRVARFRLADNVEATVVCEGHIPLNADDLIGLDPHASCTACADLGCSRCTYGTTTPEPAVEETGPDPRTVRDGICGITKVGATGIEWVCIKKVHDQGYKRSKTDRSHQGIVFGTSAHPERGEGVRAAPADRHYFVNRYPNRPQP